MISPCECFLKAFALWACAQSQAESDERHGSETMPFVGTAVIKRRIGSLNDEV
jgi:hypothetical protein